MENLEQTCQIWEGDKMEIPKKMYHNQTVHHNLTHSPNDGVLSCGYLWKPSASNSQRDIIFEHYGAFLLLDGFGHYTDVTGAKYELRPGAYVQRIPGRVHSTVVEPDGRWLEFFVCFGERTYDTLKNLSLVDDTPVIYPGVTPETFQRCCFLMELFEQTEDVQAALLYFSAQEFAAEMFRCARMGKTEADLAETAMMNRAQELLSQSRPQYLDVREVARQIGMPYERFRKKFKMFCGASPGEYQLDSRINYSKTLLLDTSKRLNEIALLCGFCDGFAYSKAFKKRCGISPREFRMKHLSSSYNYR